MGLRLRGIIVRHSIPIAGIMKYLNLWFRYRQVPSSLRLLHFYPPIKKLLSPFFAYLYSFLWYWTWHNCFLWNDSNLRTTLACLQSKGREKEIFEHFITTVHIQLVIDLQHRFYQHFFKNHIYILPTILTNSPLIAFSYFYLPVQTTVF